MSEPTIGVFEVEDRSFPPSAAFIAAANVGDTSLYDEAEADYEAFWARQAREVLSWRRDFDQILDWQLPFAKWFLGGQLNVSYNCLDRHVEAGKGDKVAFHWEGEPGDKVTLTYAQMLTEVKKFANVLKGFGLQKGDRVAIYMPMILELPIAMLACARIGVAHSVIFGGFSADAIIDRCDDASARPIITADAGYRRGAAAALKPTVDEALSRGAASVEQVVVVNRCDTDPEMVAGRDHWWHDLMAEASEDCPAEPMDSEQLLYLLYTSGTTA
ncbi:MAG: AMP-binding protein, partial [Actinomycetota bacterium]|nr:AMP-binding protein [Actinomycetota bacterium]